MTITTSTPKLPMVMVLTRKSIRLFPNDVAVGVYYSSDLDQYFAISTRGQSTNVSEETDESD